MTASSLPANGLPAWCGVLAVMDDDALAALANRGLVRRAVRLVGEGAVTLAAATADAITLTCDSATVRLLPGGPAALRCSCPVAGVCVHVVAACVWARTAIATSEAADSADPTVAEPAHDAIVEMLGWDSAAVNRSAGIAAVRRVAAQPLTPGQATIEARPGQAVISWPGSPRVIALAGAGFAGMVVEGTHADVTERAWRLGAVVRVFAAHQRPWAWPDGLGADGGLAPAQRDAAAEVAAVIERIVAGGISQADRAGADRLTRAGQRARLDDLPLLARLVAVASGQLNGLAGRSDDAGEAAVFSALAQAWALGRALVDNPNPPPALFGRSGPAEQTDGPETLVPLAARWWRSPTGARGFTLHAWDPDASRLETATTGRAAGTDPTFVRSWESPLLWGASAAALCSGPLRLTGAEHREDGTLSPTTRTRVSTGTGWGGLDLNALAESVNASETGLSRVVFGSGSDRVRIIRPRRSYGLGAIELDEVAQLLVWPVTDLAGRTHRLALDADEANVRLLTWLVELSSVLAIVAIGDRPEAAFLPDKPSPRLVSLSLTPLPIRAIGPSWRRRLLKLDEHRRSVAPLREPDDLQRLCRAVGDVAEAVAARGRPDLPARERETLERRSRQAIDLGLHTLGAAITPLLAGAVEAQALLTLRFVLDRLEALCVE